MAKMYTPAAGNRPQFRSGSWVRAGYGSHRWATTDGMTHPVTVRRKGRKVSR